LHITQKDTWNKITHHARELFPKDLLDENTLPTSLPNQRSYFYPLTTYTHTYFVTYSWTTNTSQIHNTQYYTHVSSSLLPKHVQYTCNTHFITPYYSKSIF